MTTQASDTSDANAVAALRTDSRKDVAREVVVTVAPSAGGRSSSAAPWVGCGK
jgi:hypothetical protein